MPLNIWNLEWLNHNSQRSYPIADWATKQCSESTDITLPDDFLLALSLGINACHSIDIDGFYIKSILVMDTGCSVIVGYNDKEVAVTHIVANSDQMTYALVGLGEFDDIVGYIAINPHSNIMSGLSGYYNFTREATCLEADCIRPMIKSISAIQVENGSSLSSRMYGDIVLKAGANINIALDTEDDTSVITISAIDGSGFSALCECAENEKMPPIRTINGITGGENGNLTITGSNCLTVSSGTNSLTFQDTCAEPCCGCEELDALYENVKDMIDGATTLQNAIEDLASRQQQIELVYGNEGKSPSCNCAGVALPKNDKKEEEEDEKAGIYYVYRYEFMRRFNDQGNYVSPIAYGWGQGCKTYPLKVGAYMGHGDPIDAPYLIGDYYHDPNTGATAIVADVIIERVCKYKQRSDAPNDNYYFSHRTEFLDSYIDLESRGPVLNPDGSSFVPRDPTATDKPEYDSVDGGHPSTNQACIEGRNFIRECIANTESSSEEDEPEMACAKSVYRYELQVAKEGDPARHTFMFSKDGDTPLLGIGDTVRVVGTIEDYDAAWTAIVTEVKLYRSFKYWYEADQPQLFKDEPDLFGDYWIQKNNLEEYRCYFDAVPKHKQWGPEDTDSQTDL